MDSSAADDPQQEGGTTVRQFARPATSVQSTRTAANPPNRRFTRRSRDRQSGGPITDRRTGGLAWAHGATVAIGAHVDSADPLAGRQAAGADAAQFFLADPQGWKAPVEHPHAAEIRASDLTIYIHAPYLVNVATMNNKIRIPSRKILGQHAAAAAAIGAKGLIVHGGHVLNEDDFDKGFDNWRKTFARAARRGRLRAADPDREHRRRQQRDRPPLRSAGPALGRDRRVRPRLLPRHLPRLRRRRRSRRHRRSGAGDHRTHRPGARQQQPRRLRLRRRPARQLRRRHDRPGRDRRGVPRAPAAT